MNISTKIQLSSLETELIQNKEWILTKRIIIEKVYMLFGNILETYKKILKDDSKIFNTIQEGTTGKISKGENYHGLPYVILDYPALFSKENIFAIRTLFWWGNFFSISLHVSGKFFQMQNDLPKLLKCLREKDFFICINGDQWQHTFESSNYISALKVTADELNKIPDKKFLKISKKMELGKWNDVPRFLEQTFLEIADIVRINFQDGERDPLPGFPKAGFDL